MQKINTLLCFSLIVASLPMEAKSPEPEFPQQVELTASQAPLKKMGEYRYVYRMFFKLYDIALYSIPQVEAQEILEAGTSYRLQFRYLRRIEKSIIVQTSDEVLRKNLSPDQFAQILQRVERLHHAYRTVDEGDRSSLTYEPGIGTTLRINGTPVITIEGQDFAQFYFRIWLGPNPVSDSLRESLLRRT